MSHNDEILIIGAGISGLAAAKKLAEAGLKVTILEGNERIGGRIHTISSKDFAYALELGAEFIHGDLPLTKELTELANIKTTAAEGEMEEVVDGEFRKNESFIDGWEELHEKISQLEDNITLKEFLDTNFPLEKYNTLRASVKKFVEGYDAADEDKISALAVKKEWVEVDSPQYRINEGYIQIVNYLVKHLSSYKCNILKGNKVINLKWHSDGVEVFTSNNEVFSGSKVIVTVSVGILSTEDQECKIEFNPPLPQKIAAAQKIGFGSVIKILLLFNQDFWDTHLTDSKLENLGFLFTEERIPTWWTQFPRKIPLLTGWIGGPNAEKMKEYTKEVLVDLSINCLSTVFSISERDLRNGIEEHHVVIWGKDPFVLGAYSYSTPETSEAINELRRAESDTLFFCGEAICENSPPGTVEAAIESGYYVASKIIKSKLA